MRRIGRGIAWAEDALLITILLGLVVLAVTQIGLRNLADSGLPWADPVLRAGVLWLALLGGAVASRDNRHITVDILSRRLHGGAQRLVARATHLFTAAICSTAAWVSGRFVLDEYRYGGDWVLGLPSWAPPLILPVGFGLIALRYLGHAAKATTTTSGPAPRK